PAGHDAVDHIVAERLAAPVLLPDERRLGMVAVAVAAGPTAGQVVPDDLQGLTRERHRALPLALAHESHEPLVGDEVRSAEAPDLAGAEAAVERDREDGAVPEARLAGELGREVMERGQDRDRALEPRRAEARAGVGGEVAVGVEPPAEPLERH